MQVGKWQKRKREKKGMSIEDQAKKKVMKIDEKEVEKNGEKRCLCTI